LILVRNDREKERIIFKNGNMIVWIALISIPGKKVSQN